MMDVYLFVYIVAALLFMFIDAIASLITSRKYNLIPSFLLSCIWPIMLVLVIYSAHKGINLEETSS